MKRLIKIPTFAVVLAFIGLPLDASATSANYPKESLKAGEEGRVSFTVDITEIGKPINCRVTESSGFPRLDTATCEQIEKYARFSPAVDASGKPILSKYSGRINWVIDKK